MLNLIWLIPLLPIVFVAADEACEAGALLGVLDRFAQAGIGDVSLVGAPKAERLTPE